MLAVGYYKSDLPLGIIHRIYEKHLKALSIENNSDFTRVILVIFFLCIEAFCVKVLGVDVKGFTATQMTTMKRWDRLLGELGEKYSSSGIGAGWSVEARMIGLAVFNVLTIVGVKFVCDKIGSKDTKWMLDMVNGALGGSIDELVEAKPPPVIDPVTKTVEPPVTSPANSLLGNVNSLLAMASNGLGGNFTGKNNDIAETIGNLGSKFINTEKAKSSSKKVNFGNRKKQV